MTLALTAQYQMVQAQIIYEDFGSGPVNTGAIATPPIPPDSPQLREFHFEPYYSEPPHYRANRIHARSHTKCEAIHEATALLGSAQGFSSIAVIQGVDFESLICRVGRVEGNAQVCNKACHNDGDAITQAPPRRAARDEERRTPKTPETNTSSSKVAAPEGRGRSAH